MQKYDGITTFELLQSAVNEAKPPEVSRGYHVDRILVCSEDKNMKAQATRVNRNISSFHVAVRPAMSDPWEMTSLYMVPILDGGPAQIHNPSDVPGGKRPMRSIELLSDITAQERSIIIGGLKLFCEGPSS